ncbi:MAG TPA: EscU/YscU/HrcU family type III secretion system export apparatus switch protein [Candidatus Limnocylindrales bacterium]
MAEKTEAPTPRKAEEARSKGQGIGRSHEFSMGLTLGVGTLALSALLPGMASTLVTRLQATIIDVPTRASNAQLIGETGDAIITTLTMILPLAFLVLIAGVAGNLVSGGLVFSFKAIRFDLSRINPLSGLKRIVDKQALVRLGLSSAKLAILAYVSWQVVGSRVPAIVATQGASAEVIAGSCLSAIFQLGLTITVLLAVVALVDFVVQRRKAQNSIKMSKEEVKQEYRESEGDPMVRHARKRRARQMAFSRMMDAVPTADVVVTNPTTLAVVLKYDSLTMKAPKIVGKGQRLMAERIKEIARENNVPVIEDKPLARALFSRPIGSEVPSHLYRAVARLLVLVHQARFKGAGRGAPGRPGTSGWTPGARGAAAGAAGQGETWWNAGGASRGRSGLNTDGAGSVPADAAAAAQAYGSAVGPSTNAGPEIIDPIVAADFDAAVGRDDGAETAEWLDDAALAPGDVDEAALAVAMAEDELADVTADELAQLEASLVLGNTTTELVDTEQDQ